MDAERFDHLARSLSAAGSRRGILALLTGLPLGGVLSLWLGAEPSDAKRRKKGNQQGKKDRSQDKRRVGGENHKHEHRRRKHKNKRRNGHKNKHKGKHLQECRPQSLAQTCEDRCGQVQNNCQQEVDCGSCECQSACAACQRCDETTTTCQADPAQVGDACGDGLVCQEDGECACQGDSCGGCRACDDGRCVVDTTVVCTAQDQCHEAGECDPETGACTNPRKDDDTPCDDNDPCTTDDTCQNGACTGGPARDCSGEADVCNDGACRPSDGACVKQPKRDGASCNADNDSCTTGDSCQNGVCTPGAGVDCQALDDQCNRGVCRQSDGACIKAPRPDGTLCGANGQCRSGNCEEVVCLALRESCDPSDNQCCGADCAETLPNCFEAGTRCCRGTRQSCGHDCECCGVSFCESSQCCSHTGSACGTAADCCQNVLNQQACVAGACCALPNEPCEGPNDCCEGLCSPEGFCTSCLDLQQVCAPDNNRCCQRGGVTNCESACDFNNPTCCHASGGTCATACDCCGGEACPDGFCCSPRGAICPGSGECCPGLECDGRIGQCSCESNASYCDGGPEGGLTVCCDGEGACQSTSREPGRKRCCFPDGTPCNSNEVFGHLGCCGGYCNTASGTCSSTCTPVGGQCRHPLECCGVLPAVDCLGVSPDTPIGTCGLAN